MIERISRSREVRYDHENAERGDTMDIPKRLSEYGMYSIREISLLPIKEQEKVIFEIVNYLIQKLPELISEIIANAKAKHVVNIIVWDTDGTPKGALFVQAMRLENSPLRLSIMFDGQLVLGLKLENPDGDYYEKQGIHTWVKQMENSMTIDDMMKTPTITSIDDKVGVLFPLTLMSFFDLVINISNVAARRKMIPREDSQPIYELATLGSNTLSHIHFLLKYKI